MQKPSGTRRITTFTDSAITLCLSIAGLAMTGAVMAEGQSTAHATMSQGPRAPLAMMIQLSAPRSPESGGNAHRVTLKERQTRTVEPKDAGVRMTQKMRPQAARTATTASPHAIRPLAAQQLTARSPEPNLRAPANVMGLEGSMAMDGGTREQTKRGPRARIERETTRTTRASFKDWLFGR